MVMVPMLTFHSSRDVVASRGDSFNIVIQNPKADMAIAGIRLSLGRASSQHIARTIQVFDRCIRTEVFCALVRSVSQTFGSGVSYPAALLAHSASTEGRIAIVKSYVAVKRLTFWCGRPNGKRIGFWHDRYGVQEGKPRWYDIPLTESEILRADREVCPSVDAIPDASKNHIVTSRTLAWRGACACVTPHRPPAPLSISTPPPPFPASPL